MFKTDNKDVLDNLIEHIPKKIKIILHSLKPLETRPETPTNPHIRHFRLHSPLQILHIPVYIPLNIK